MKAARSPRSGHRRTSVASATVIAINSIGGQIAVAGDIINARKANAGVEITGTASGVEDGRVVAATIVDSSNHVVYSGTATVTNGTWSLNATAGGKRRWPAASTR